MKIENKNTEALSFVAFKGNANRIDGKSVGEAAPRKSDEADGKSAPTFRGSDVSGVQKSSIPTTGGRTLLGTNNSITEGSGYPNANSASAVLGFESRQSKIGDKYSKKKDYNNKKNNNLGDSKATQDFEKLDNYIICKNCNGNGTVKSIYNFMVLERDCEVCLIINIVIIIVLIIMLYINH
jgi:hypothetical protein